MKNLISFEQSWRELRLRPWRPRNNARSYRSSAGCMLGGEELHRLRRTIARLSDLTTDHFDGFVVDCLSRNSDIVAVKNA
ncbi:hypothetical protein LINPERHAP1_LOCUS30254, partial [Linum perenne]